ncbi:MULTISPECIES: lysozyme [unclassified Paenibacillus]|uniref:lysozyme n=1 Tax=unclassified Paenibacillus TaxID=185978 RepID=UPI0030F942FC
MSYSVDLSQTQWVNFAPSTLHEEVAQNIRTIVTTALGSAPGSRGIGIDWSLIDDPVPVAQARLSGLIISAILEQEPRATVTEVTFSNPNVDEPNKLLPVIKFVVEEGA